MPRFITNRWWTFILALILGVGAALALPNHASADGGGTGSTITDGGVGGGGDIVPPPGNGDPDIPIGSVKKSSWGGATQPATDTYRMQTVGDGLVMDRALMWRLQILMQVLRSIWFRG